MVSCLRYVRVFPHSCALFAALVVSPFRFGHVLRFGTVALTESERGGLWTVFSGRPDLLLTVVKELVKVTGVR